MEAVEDGYIYEQDGKERYLQREKKVGRQDDGEELEGRNLYFPCLTSLSLIIRGNALVEFPFKEIVWRVDDFSNLSLYERMLLLKDCVWLQGDLKIFTIKSLGIQSVHASVTDLKDGFSLTHLPPDLLVGSLILTDIPIMSLAESFISPHHLIELLLYSNLQVSPPSFMQFGTFACNLTSLRLLLEKLVLNNGLEERPPDLPDLCSEVLCTYSPNGLTQQYLEGWVGAGLPNEHITEDGPFSLPLPDLVVPGDYGYRYEEGEPFAGLVVAESGSNETYRVNGTSQNAFQNKCPDTVTTEQTESLVNHSIGLEVGDLFQDDPYPSLCELQNGENPFEISEPVELDFQTNPVGVTVQTGISDSHHVKGNEQEKKISAEALQPFLSKRMKLVDAAKELGVSRTTLKRRLRELGIPKWPTSRIKKTKHDLKSARSSEFSGLNSPNPSSSADQEHASANMDGTNQPMPISCSASDSTRLTTVKQTGQKVSSQMFPETRLAEYGSATKLDGGPHKFVVKVTYKNDTVKIYMPCDSSFDKLKEKVAEKLKLGLSDIKLKYQDDDDETILMIDNSDLKDALRVSSSSEKIVLRLSLELS